LRLCFSGKSYLESLILNFVDTSLPEYYYYQYSEYYNRPIAVSESEETARRPADDLIYVKALRVLAIALLTAIAGAVASIAASLYLTELYHVSNFEGGRAMLSVFALAPLGFIVGLIIGLIVALLRRGTGFSGFVKAQGIALGITISVAAIVSGILYLAADHPPKLDGKSLAVDFELKVPPTLKLPAQPNEQTLHASLYANNRDNRFALLDYDRIVSHDGYTFVPGKASLLSQTFNRDLFVCIEGEGGAGQFIKLKLPAKPRKEDEAWSDWITATKRADLSPVPEAERIAVRYRVQPEE
jgi:hypothetical protein